MAEENSSRPVGTTLENQFLLLKGRRKLSKTLLTSLVKFLFTQKRDSILVVKINSFQLQNDTHMSFM